MILHRVLLECLEWSHRLLDENCFVLQCLGKKIPFELAIGMNGRVWVNAHSPIHIILISNAILNSERMTNSVIQMMVQKLFETIE